jgi:hypothetical protein
MSADRPCTSWQPRDLSEESAALDPPVYLRRSDGMALLYAGRLHGLHGEPESGKTWVAAAACAEEVQNGRNVVVLDFEDGPAAWKDRLLALGSMPEELRARVRYVQPNEPISERGWDDLRPALRDASLVVVDSTNAAMAVEGLNLADNADVLEWIKTFVQPLQSEGAAVLLLDHVVKEREARGRYPIGGQAKLASLDVAYSIRVTEPWGRGRAGSAEIKVRKDRAGYVRSFQNPDERVALLQVIPADDGGLDVTLEPPTQTALGRSAQPDEHMVRVSLALKAEPGLTTQALRSAVTGKYEKVDAAADSLVEQGYVERTKVGPAHVHRLVRPYPANADDGGVPALPVPEDRPVPTDDPKEAP